MLPNVPDEQTGMRLALTGDGHNSAAATAIQLETHLLFFTKHHIHRQLVYI